MSRRSTILLTIVAAMLLLSGCITGERPTVISTPAAEIDDPAATSVLDRLERADRTTFTATYRIIPSSTGATTEATVEANDGDLRVTIGEVEFASDGEHSRTCRNSGDGATDCVDFLDDARISDLNITHEFWGDAFAARLRLDVNRRVGFTEAQVVDIAGRPAACVDVPLPSAGSEQASVRYCALDEGPLARYFGADVSIELTSYEPTAADLSI